MRSVFIIALLVSLGFSSCQRKNMDRLAETIYVKSDNASMPAYVFGNGSSKNFVVVLHGGPGGYGLQYRNKTSSDQLEEEVAMVYWDQRGQGMAQGNYGTDFMTQLTIVQDLRKLILVLKDRYGQDINVYLLGHSWGGLVGTAFLLFPENQALVKGWIEVDGAHDMPKIAVEAVKRFQEVSPFQAQLGVERDWWLETLDFVNGIDANNISDDDFLELNQRAFKGEEYMLENGTIQLNADFRLPNLYGPTNFLTQWITGRVTNAILDEETSSTSFTSRLNEITLPCMFIWGEFDLVVPVELGIDAHKRVSSVEKSIHILPTSGHSPMTTDPDLYSTLVLDFIDRTQ